MTSDDLDAFCTLWNNMYANFDRVNAPDVVLTTAFNSLKEYEFKDVAEIVRQALENCERLPALARPDTLVGGEHMEKAGNRISFFDYVEAF